MTTMAVDWDAFTYVRPVAMTGTEVKSAVRPLVRPASSSTVVAEDDTIAGTSDKAQEHNSVIEREAKDLFDVARYTERHVGVEIGMDNLYRDSVHAFLQQYGAAGIRTIKRLLPLQSPAVQAMTIMYLGDADAPRTAYERFLLAVYYLESEHPELRDAAGLALVDLDNELAVPVLAVAIEKEPLRSLKRNLEQARSYLKRPR